MLAVPIASKLLAVGSASGASDKLVYTVPAGHVTIVKHVILVNYNAAPQDVALTLGLPSGTRWTVFLGTFQSYETAATDMWAVMPPNYKMGVYPVAGGACVYWVSGSELTGTNEVPTVPTDDPALEPMWWNGVPLTS